MIEATGPLSQVLMEMDASGGPVAYYVYGIGLAQRISTDDKIHTYHFNVQGSTIALTDSTGSITDSYAYDSFGSMAHSAGESPQPFRYLGHYGIVDDVGSSRGGYQGRKRARRKFRDQNDYYPDPLIHIMLCCGTFIFEKALS